MPLYNYKCHLCRRIDEQIRQVDQREIPYLCGCEQVVDGVKEHGIMLLNPLNVMQIKMINKRNREG